eukprot:scaffold5341_cov72-Cyclotella_meneghiniana.AAC.1
MSFVKSAVLYKNKTTTRVPMDAGTCRPTAVLTPYILAPPTRPNPSVVARWTLFIHIDIDWPKANTRPGRPELPEPG